MNTRLRDLASDALWATAGRWKLSPRVVLMYHSIASTPEAGHLTVHTDEFAWQIGFLKARYRLTTVAGVLDAPPGQSVAAITIDDGYAHLLPRVTEFLARESVPAVIYVPSALLGGTMQAGTRAVRVMSAEGVRHLARSGFEIGSHTRMHPELPSLNEGEAVREIEGSKKDLEDLLGRPVTDFAYPRGKFDRRVRDLVARAGYERAVTVEKRSVRRGEDPFAVPRIAVDALTSRARFKLRLSSAGNVLLTIKGAGRR